MSNYNLTKIEKKMKKKLTPERYRHTLGVMYTCGSLAMCHGADLQEALTAGLLHDCAKCISDEKKIKICKKHHIPISEAERENPYLLHAKAGAYLAKKKYKVKEKKIRDAIRYHTTGRPNMSMLEKITFIADYIEPWRSKAPNLDRIRATAYRDLDQAVYLILRDTLSYLKNDKRKIDPATQEAYECYAALTKAEKGKGKEKEGKNGK